MVSEEGSHRFHLHTDGVAEVEVDEKTGVVEVTRIYIAHDIGRSLNPAQVEGQVIGGVYMGLGEALMEETTSRRLPPKLSDALLHDSNYDPQFHQL